MTGGIIVNKEHDNSRLEELMNRRLELVKAEDKEAITANVEEIFMEIMDHALLVTAIKMTKPPKTLPNGEQAIADGTGISFYMLAANDGEHYLPMFTKRAEMEKWKSDTERNTVLMGFDNMSMIVETNPNCAGIVVNPFGQNFVIPRRFVEDMKERRDMLRDGQTNSVLTADTPCELYALSPYPMEMSSALVETAKGTGAIDALWLRGVKLEGKDGYLLLVDFNGDRNVVFSRLGQAARPFLQKMPLHIIDAKSGFGANAVNNVMPFYTRS
ncbi:MAG: enhanced serine sensitivity protein SseB [Oscillospiraceae bacterium]|nr:enhanced serine sensitivity protein SseB [Oscillospiraceae bacterium]